jgi:2-polyprenyl-3-methyl-5-hydroxy-6-metoxy-1,4-benzoquinol methylase
MILKNVPCAVCGSKDCSFVNSCAIESRDAKGFEGSLTLVRCRSCGFLFVNPRPEFDQEEKSRLYGEAYFQAEYMRFYADADPEASKQSNESFEERLRFIARYKKTGRLLDIGCAAGGFLKFMESRGWQGWGCEVSPVASRRAREEHALKVTTGEMAGVVYEEKFFDVICAGDVLEHVEEPFDFLRRARKVLKDDGILYVAAPNADSLSYAVFSLIARFNHKNYFVLPHHISHFSPGTMRLLMRRAGFEAVFVARKNSNVLDRGIRRIYLNILKLLAVCIGAGDRFVMIARKKESS